VAPRHELFEAHQVESFRNKLRLMVLYYSIAKWRTVLVQHFFGVSNCQIYEAFQAKNGYQINVTCRRIKRKQHPPAADGNATTGNATSAGNQTEDGDPTSLMQSGQYLELRSLTIISISRGEL
jgi:hypothetical protein